MREHAAETIEAITTARPDCEFLLVPEGEPAKDIVCALSSALTGYHETMYPSDRSLSITLVTLCSAEPTSGSAER